MKIIYSSGLHISEESELSSLSIVYDKILLPASDEITCSEGVILRKERKKDIRLKLAITAVRGWTFTDKKSGHTVQAEDFIENWNRKNSVLFSEGVLERLPKSKTLDHSETMRLTGKYLDELASPILRMPYLVQSDEHIYIWQDHLDHLLRDDFEYPSLFTSRTPVFSREIMKALVIFPAFRYVIPRANELNPEQILTIREKTKDNREGFTYHIQALTEHVESRIREGDTIKDVAGYAASTLSI